MKRYDRYRRLVFKWWHDLITTILPPSYNMLRRIGIGTSSRSISKALLGYSLCEQVSPDGREHIYTTAGFLPCCMDSKNFFGEPFGTCWDLCYTLCNEVDSFTSFQGSKCTCGPEICESDGTCLELKDEITNLTFEKESPCGDSSKWMYFSPANSWSAKVPVMTSDGAIIWNYLGQIVCPIQLRVSMDEVIYWEKNVLKVMRNLSTVTGRQDAQTSQAEYENELHDWYELDNDIGYPGSFIDYLVSFNGFDLHWMNYIPYVAITLSNSASIGNFKWWLEFMNVIPINDPMPPDKHIADHPEAKKLSACQCILPPMGCHVGGSDIIAEECLKWPVFPKVMPCEDFGFTANHEDKNEFAGFFF